MIPQDQIDALKRVFPDLELGEESGVEYIVIRGLVLPDGCQPDVIDALLCPTPRDGYQSRLFVSAKLSHQGNGTNWNADGVLILQSRWWAVSWQTREGQTLLEMVQDHLRAFRNETSS